MPDDVLGEEELGVVELVVELEVVELVVVVEVVEPVVVVDRKKLMMCELLQRRLRRESSS